MVRENRLAALPGLWGPVPLQGRVVTGDAQLTRRELCEENVAKGG